jgi:haloalkane dehalogenase
VPPHDERSNYRMAREALLERVQAPREVHRIRGELGAEAAAAAYDAPFPTPESKAGLLAFPELVPTELDHPSAGKMLEVREAARSWSKPALVLFGDSDPIFPPRAAERMSELIGGAEPAQTVANAGHFVQEDAGE